MKVYETTVLNKTQYIDTNKEFYYTKKQFKLKFLPNNTGEMFKKTKNNKPKQVKSVLGLGREKNRQITPGH